MGEYAETQGRPHPGEKLRTWKVTRLSGEVSERGVGAQGVRCEGPGRGERMCMLCTRGMLCASIPHPAGVVPVLFAVVVCTRCVRLVWQPFVSSWAEEGYLILSISTRGGRVGGRGSVGRSGRADLPHWRFLRVLTPLAESSPGRRFGAAVRACAPGSASLSSE